MKTNSLKVSAVKHPILHSLLIIFIFEVAMFGFGLLVAGLAPSFFVENGDFLFQGTIEAFLCMAGIGLVAMYGYNSIWSEKGVGFGKGLLVGGYFIMTSAAGLGLNLLMGIGSGMEWELPWKMAVYIICFLLVGFCEEVFYRGVLANLFYDKYAKDPAGVWTATLWSGMLFGLMHIFNMVGAADRQYIVGVLVQVFSACTLGIALSAIYFRCRNIWVMAFIHSMHNICNALSAGFFKGGSLTETIGSYSPEMFFTALPYLVVAIVLLRPSKVKEIIDYRRTSEGLPVHDGEVISAKKNKTSLVIAIVFSAVVTLTMFGMSCFLYEDPTVLNHTSRSFIEPGDTVVTSSEGAEDIELTVEEDGSYTLIVQSIAVDEKARATVSITDNGEEVFSVICGGSCTDLATVWLEAGNKYVVTVVYDYTDVELTEMGQHIVNITVTAE